MHKVYAFDNARPSLAAMAGNRRGARLALGRRRVPSAFRKRCGRALQTVELRRAFAEGSGDPTLMAMVRATHQKDTAAVQRLGATIACPRG